MTPAAEEVKQSLPAVPVERISPAEKVALVPEVLRAYWQARREVSRSDLPAALHVLRGPANSASDEQSTANELTCDQLAGAVRKTLALLPTRSRCLMQSLTLTAMLARRGIDTSLVIGVTPGMGSGADEFGAHAWVEYHGRPLLPVFRSRFDRLTEV